MNSLQQLPRKRRNSFDGRGFHLKTIIAYETKKPASSGSPTLKMFYGHWNQLLAKNETDGFLSAAITLNYKVSGSPEALGLNVMEPIIIIIDLL